ncbi:MAG: hypothetical protein LC790_03620, partial [Actinobacteria bacterium]|nr:hypothetical protein [Actinomycetota bacterium]
AAAFGRARRVVAAAAPAQGFRLVGHRWPKSTITYHNATAYKDAVRASAWAWNTSGARVRFRRPHTARRPCRSNTPDTAAGDLPTPAGRRTRARR